MPITEKNTRTSEITKEKTCRNYGPKEKWKLAEMILILQEGDDIKNAMLKTGRKENSVSFFVDTVYAKIAEKNLNTRIGFSDSSKMLDKALTIVSPHSSFYASAAERVSKRLVNLKIKRVAMEVVE